MPQALDDLKTMQSVYHFHDLFIDYWIQLSWLRFRQGFPTLLVWTSDWVSLTWIDLDMMSAYSKRRSRTKGILMILARS